MKSSRHYGEATLSPAWLAVCISAAAFVVSAASASFTVVNIMRGQENLSIRVERDLKAGLEPARMGMIIDPYEAENGLKSHWIVQVSNTSISTSLSLIRLEVEVTQFLGNSTLLPDTLDTWSGVKSPCALEGSSAALQFPIKLTAGETIIADCDAKVSLKRESAKKFEGGVPHEENGKYMMFVDGGFDMFGNAGETTPDGLFAAVKPADVQQPRLSFRVETARGYSYSAIGSWYTRLAQLTQPQTPTVMH